MEKYISVIVPVYNVADYLQECVESLEEQNIDHISYEVLLIDDGSTDDSGKICDSLEKKYNNIKVFHKTNGGLSDARNYGLRKAEGKYILFVDSDDYIQKNILKKLIMACKQQKEPQCIFLQAQKVYDNRTTVKYDIPMQEKIFKMQKEEIIHYIADRDMYPASAWSKMINRCFLIENKILFKKGQLSEDYEWTLNVLLNADTFGCFNENYYFYRQNREGSITKKISEKHILDLINIIENMENISYKIENKHISDDILKIAAYIYRVLLWNVSKYYKKYKKQIDNKKYLLDKKNSKDIKIIRSVSRCIGINNTIRLLDMYRRIR